MVHFCLNDEFAKTDAEAGRLLLELRLARTQPIYRTYVFDSDSKKKAILFTTNEKLHLAIGKIPDVEQAVLARLFMDKLMHGGQLVFTFQPSEGESVSRSLVVTGTRDDDDYWMFHISPGH